MDNSVIAVQIADGSFVPVLDTSTQKRRRLVVTTVRDNQTDVRVELFRGSDESMSDAEYIGSLVIHDIEPGKAGDADISVLTGVDESGNLNVTATNSNSGEYESLSVSLEELASAGEAALGDFQIASNSGDELEDIDLEDLSLDDEPELDAESLTSEADETELDDVELDDVELESLDLSDDSGPDSTPELSANDDSDDDLSLDDLDLSLDEPDLGDASRDESFEEPAPQAADEPATAEDDEDDELSLDDLSFEDDDEISLQDTATQESDDFTLDDISFDEETPSAPSETLDEEEELALEDISFEDADEEDADEDDEDADELSLEPPESDDEEFGLDDISFDDEDAGEEESLSAGITSDDDLTLDDLSFDEEVSEPSADAEQETEESDSLESLASFSDDAFALDESLSLDENDSLEDTPFEESAPDEPGLEEADLGDEDFTFDDTPDEEPLFAGDTSEEFDEEFAAVGAHQDSLDDTLSAEEFDRLDSRTESSDEVVEEDDEEEGPLAPRRSNGLIYAGYIVLALAAVGVLTYLVFRLLEGPPAPPLRASYLRGLAFFALVRRRGRGKTHRSS